MASLKDLANSIGNFFNGAGQAVQAVTQPFTTSQIDRQIPSMVGSFGNSAQQAFSAPFAAIQQAVQNPNFLRVPQLPQVPQQAQQVPVLGSLLNMDRNIANWGLDTYGNIPNRSFQGAVGLGENVRHGAQGNPDPIPQIFANVAKSAELPVALYTLKGIGAPATVGYTATADAAKPGVWSAINQGGLTAAKGMLPFSAINAIGSTGNAPTVKDQLKQAAPQFIKNEVAAYLFGAGTSAVGYGLGKIVNKVSNAYQQINPQASDAEAKQAATNFLRDEKGRFSGSSGLSRNALPSNEPVYYGDLRESLGLPRNGDYQSGKINFGEIANSVKKGNTPGSIASQVGESGGGSDAMRAFDQAINKGDLGGAQQILTKATPDEQQSMQSVLKLMQGNKTAPLQTGAGAEVIGPIEPSAGEVADAIKKGQLTFNDAQNLGLDVSQAQKVRGFVENIKTNPNQNVSTAVRGLVNDSYTPKSNTQLQDEAMQLLQGGNINLGKVKHSDQAITAAIQEAINQDAAGNHEAAANLYTNLAQNLTEHGRAVQAASLLDKMSPESYSLTAAKLINQYNETASKKIPSLTEAQQTAISDAATAIQNMPEGRDKNIAVNNLVRQINDYIPSSITDKAVTVWKAGLLTSLRTHERNLLGNSISQGAEISKDLPASVADQIMSLRTGQRTLTPTVRGMAEGGKIGLQSAKDQVQLGFDPSNDIAKYDVHHVTWGNNPFEQAMKKYTDAVFNTLSAADQPYYNAAYARSLYDQAGAQAINMGAKGDQAVIQGLVHDPTPDMTMQAAKDAAYATFHDQNVASSIANAIKRAASQSSDNAIVNALGKITTEVVSPFTGVPSSVAGHMISYSPIGLAKGAIETGKVLTNNVPELQRQAAQDLGRGVVGTALFSLGAYLASKGLISGQPKDAQEAAQWQLEGKSPNSILLGGKWRSIGSIGPQNLIALAGAKWQEEHAKGAQADYGSAAFNVGKDFLGQTFLQGVQQPLAALNDPARYGKSYVGNQVSSVIPNIVKDTAKALDPYARESNTIVDYLTNATPFLRNNNTPTRDTLGNPVQQAPTGLGAFVDLFNSRQPITSDVIGELNRLNASGNNATPGKLAKNQKIGGVKMVLTPQQLNALESAAGPEVTKGLDQLIKSPEYQMLSDEEKANAIQSAVTKIRNQVKATIDIPATEERVKSSDSPNNLLDLFKVYAEGLAVDPQTTLKIMFGPEQMRKITGNAVIVERQKGLSSLDGGDKTTQVDHIIALELGGSNDRSNLQVLSTQENLAKGQVENYLAGLLKNGTINKAEAQKRDLNWKQEINNLPPVEKMKALTILNTPTETLTQQPVAPASTTTAAPVPNQPSDTQSNDPTVPVGINQIYKLVNSNGNIKIIDLTHPIATPGYYNGNTDLTTLDQKKISAYNNAITSRINDIYTLVNAQKISEAQAQQAVDGLASQKLDPKTGLRVASRINPAVGGLQPAPKAKKAKVTKARKIGAIKTPRTKAAVFKLKQTKMKTFKLPKSPTFKVTKAQTFKAYKAPRFKTLG